MQLLLAAATLRRSLTELIRLRRAPDHTLTSMEAVEATADWMRTHLSPQATLAAFAKMAGMSPSRYSDISRQRFGFPPIDWFMRQRVQRACLLLDVTREKVEIVGLEVGFHDPTISPVVSGRSWAAVQGTIARLPKVNANEESTIFCRGASSHPLLAWALSGITSSSIDSNLPEIPRGVPSAPLDAPAIDSKPHTSRLAIP